MENSAQNQNSIKVGNAIFSQMALAHIADLQEDNNEYLTYHECTIARIYSILAFGQNNCQSLTNDELADLFSKISLLHDMVIVLKNPS